MADYSLFDRLVMGLSATERASMLEKLQQKVDPETQSLESTESLNGSNIRDIEIQLKSESLFLRFWLFIKSILTNTDRKTLYNAYIITNRGKLVEKKYPRLIDSYKRFFLQGFYDSLEELSKCTAFFKDGITAYEEDPGGFYVFLSTLIAPEISRQISDEVNPAQLPFDREVTNELRVSMVRKLESILQSMPAAKRSALYEAVCSVEWLRQFVHLPFNRILSSFTDENGQKICPFDTVKSDVGAFARVLCNGKNISPEVLEALFIFSADKVPGDQPDFSEQVAKFMEAASGQISLIKMFITTVPMKAIGSLVFFDASWIPDFPEGCEDWFIKFKNTWKKAFDHQWDQWLANRKKDVLLHTMGDAFNFDSFPLLPYRPWKNILGGTTFLYDYILGFINAFYEKIYPEYKKTLKILLVEGVFYLKDNLIELTDSCAEMDHQQDAINKIKDQLAPDGEMDVLFNKLKYENLHTPRGKAKLDSLMKSLEADGALILSQWCSAARSLHMIVEGVVSGVRNSRYDTISNLSTIQGKQNAAYREKLLEIQTGISDSLSILKELETLC